MWSVHDENAMERRKIEEMSFHDQRERDRLALSDAEFRRKYSNKKWYSVTERSTLFLEQWLQTHTSGKTVLDYCCGLGGTSLRLARYGATVHAIDISPESVETARKKLDEEGLADRGTFQVMDAEQTTFPDNTFDVIVCLGVLHHLDVSRAFPELRRILKPDGQVFAGEALGYNPIIAAYRQLTPHLRTGWEKDHILTNKELRVARESFKSIDVTYFHLFSILAVPFRATPMFTKVLRVLNWVDSWVLRIPGVRLMAWQMIFVLSQPKKA